MAAKQPHSPNGLAVRGAPLASARLSPKAALGAVAVLATMLGFIIVNVTKEKPKATAKKAEAALLQPALSSARSLTMDVPDIAHTSKPIAVPELPAQTTLPPPIARAEERDGKGKRSTPSSDDQVRMAGSEISQSASGGASAEDVSLNVSPGGGASGTIGALAGNGDPANEPDLNRLLDKLAFLTNPRESGYLQPQLKAPRSPFEIKTVIVIPSVLLSALNSDLSGDMVAQLAQNVYDTASGNHLLIPQVTNLFGHYDSKVAFGQGRLLVSWQRPNARARRRNHGTAIRCTRPGPTAS